MGLVILTLLIVVGISTLMSKIDNENWFGYVRGGVTIGIVLAVIVAAVSLSMSYATYLSDRAFYTATQRQYKDAITMYNDCMAVNYKMMQRAITDFTGKTYASEVSVKIEQFRKSVTNYNKSIVKKRTMVGNVLFIGIVVPPDDDMKIIELKLE
ncbi:MAG: hypothetical protein DRO87_08535 [Candidatus Thorarchaeota archaeon]|nr:MAG: hypothetical protein DRO87_08535 [Candidatus Thorarchaeota archaeon]